jgi:hypothetical protein
MSIRRSLSPLALPVFAVALLTGCSPGQGGSASSGGEPVNGANHVLRFEVGPSGSIAAPVAMKTTEGADVKLKLNNRNAQRYTLRVTGPRGEKKAAVVAQGHDLGQTDFVFARTGTYTIAIYRAGGSSPQRKFPLTVRGG